MEIDLFGLKFGGRSQGGYKKVVQYEISKEQLCRALGFESANVSYISYDYKVGKLIIKSK